MRLAPHPAVKNAGWIIVGRLANKVLAFLVSIVTARYLGPENYGLINYAAAYITFFASLCTLGIKDVIVKDFADHPEEEGAAVGTAMVLRLLSSLLSMVMIVGLAAIADGGEPLTVAVVALCSLGLVFQVFDAVNQWFQAKLRSKFAVAAALAGYAAASVYKIILLISGRGVLWFALSGAVDHLVMAAFLVAAYRRCGGPRLTFSWSKGKALLNSSKGFILSGLMVSVYAVTDKLMLKHMLGEGAVGHYALAVSLSTAWAFVLSAVIDSVNPLLIPLHAQDRPAFLRGTRQLYAAVFYAAAAVSLIICLRARPLVLFLYGENYLPAVDPLRVVVWYTAFSYLGVARNSWIVCEGQQHWLKYLYGGGAALNVLLNLALIPVLGGTGAALASLVTQAAVAIFLPAAIPALRPNARLMLEAVLLRCVFPRKTFQDRSESL